MLNYLCIEYADPLYHSDPIILRYRLLDNPIVEKWIDRILAAQIDHSIDDPQRFYGFNSFEQEIELALIKVNRCIDIINLHDTIIERRLESIDDYDTLNYLHHIFEVYHGLLDQQTHSFYLSAPNPVKKALADLNICVHRCESVSRGSKPRHVVTYYGLPKTRQLTVDDYQYFTDEYKFGTVYLNYVEIGKTIEDLAVDDDQYISDEAFKPFINYSADFAVMFFDSDSDTVDMKRRKISRYYDEHQTFFLRLGLNKGHHLLKPGKIPLARLDFNESNVLNLLKHRQFVKSVYFT